MSRLQLYRRVLRHLLHSIKLSTVLPDSESGDADGIKDSKTVTVRLRLTVKSSQALGNQFLSQLTLRLQIFIDLALIIKYRYDIGYTISKFNNCKRSYEGIITTAAF